MNVTVNLKNHSIRGMNGWLFLSFVASCNVAEEVATVAESLS